MRFPVLLKVFPLLLVVLVAGCHRGDKKGDEVEYLPVEKMYEIGKTALDDRNYGKVIKYDERLIARFPFGAYTEQATLDLAYAQYKTGKPEDAYSTINRFISASFLVADPVSAIRNDRRPRASTSCQKSVKARSRHRVPRAGDDGASMRDYLS